MRGGRASGALVGASSLQAEGYGDGFGGFDGLAVERSRLVTPLTDGVRGGGNEQRRAGCLVDVLNAAIAGDDGVELDDAFDALALGVFWIGGLDARKQLADLEAGSLFGNLRFQLGWDADRGERARADGHCAFDDFRRDRRFRLRCW